MTLLDEKRGGQVKTLLLILVLFVILVYVSFYTAKLAGNLNLEPSLFAPALIAVLGSFALYLLRQHRLKSRMKIALKTELEQMGDLSSLPEDFEDIQTPPPNDDIPPEKVPTPESLPTTVYESSNSQLSLLEPWIYSKVVEFYTLILRHKPTLRKIHDGDNPIMANQEDLYHDAEKLRDKRQELLDNL